MVVKTKKGKKKKIGRHGHGASWRGSGRHGGCGMAGTGKIAEHKKSLVIKLYGNKYFGKGGITSKGTQKRKVPEINLRDIQKNIDSLSKKFTKDGILILKKYKILGEGELKIKLKIKANAATKSAIEKVKKAGGEIILPQKIKKEVKKTVKETEITKEQKA